MRLNKLILNLDDKNLDGMILGTGVMASLVDWIAQHTDLVAIWVGTIIIPATIRIWHFREKLKDNALRRKRETELHDLAVHQLEIDIEQDKELHEQQKNKKR